MNDKLIIIFGFSFVVIFFVISLSTLFFVNGFLQSKEPVRKFTVTAEGEVTVVPDIAEFNYSVISEGGEDLAALQKENSERSNRINSFLKEQGIPETDIKTIGYDITPRYKNFPCSDNQKVCLPPEIVGYTITHSVNVKVKDLSLVSKLISGVVHSGANSTSNISFSIDDLDKVKEKAREIAFEKAKAKAVSIANLAEVKLGKIISINENFFTPFEPPVFTKSFSAEVSPSPLPVIEPGSKEVKVTVSLVYEIK